MLKVHKMTPAKHMDTNDTQVHTDTQIHQNTHSLNLKYSDTQMLIETQIHIV